MSIAGEPKSIKNLRSGDLLIQCAKESHEKSLLQMKTFCGLKCSVKIGFMNVKVDVYIPNPLRCYLCQVFGHHENKCGRHAVCCSCGEPEHCGPSGVCDKPAKCVNCSGDHPANSKQCPQWEKEKKILKIKCENNLPFPEARKQYEQFYTGQTSEGAVKPGTCNKSTQTDNKSTQTDNSFNEYLKQQTTEKTQGTQEKRNSSPHPGKSNSSHHGPALKQATLDMMKKDEENKRKEEKDKKKMKDDRSISKKKHRKIKKKLKKQKNLKRIHILCLVKMIKMMKWKMFLWFSQSHPPVIIYQKAHCHDYH